MRRNFDARVGDLINCVIYCLKEHAKEHGERVERVVIFNRSIELTTSRAASVLSYISIEFD